MDDDAITAAQRIVKERINIYAALRAEYRKGEPGANEWRRSIAEDLDKIAGELRDVLRVMEAVGA